MQKILKRRRIRRISGVLLIVIGILIAKGDYKTFNIIASKWQSKLSGKAPYVESTVYDTDGNVFIQPEDEIEKTINNNDN